MEDLKNNLLISRSIDNPAVLIAICRICGKMVGVSLNQENLESTAREHVCAQPEINLTAASAHLVQPQK